MSTATEPPGSTGSLTSVVSGASSTGVTVMSTITERSDGRPSSTTTSKLSGPLKLGAGV